MANSRSVACIFADGVTRWVRTTDEAKDITDAWSVEHAALKDQDPSRQWLAGYVLVDLTEVAFARIFAESTEKTLDVATCEWCGGHGRELGFGGLVVPCRHCLGVPKPTKQVASDA